MVAVSSVNNKFRLFPLKKMNMLFVTYDFKYYWCWVWLFLENEDERDKYRHLATSWKSCRRNNSRAWQFMKHCAFCDFVPENCKRKHSLWTTFFFLIWWHFKTAQICRPKRKLHSLVQNTRQKSFEVQNKICAYLCLRFSYVVSSNTTWSANRFPRYTSIMLRSNSNFDASNLSDLQRETSWYWSQAHCPEEGTFRLFRRATCTWHESENPAGHNVSVHVACLDKRKVSNFCWIVHTKKCWLAFWTCMLISLRSD